MLTWSLIDGSASGTYDGNTDSTVIDPTTEAETFGGESRMSEMKWGAQILLPLFNGIDSRLLQAKNTGRSLLVAIEGPCGAGKSTLADLLRATYGEGTNIVHMDDFFLPPELQTPDRLAEPGGNIDYDRFRNEVTAGLHSNRPFSYRIYDCSVRTRTETIIVKPGPLTVVEGVYSLHPALRLDYGFRVFLSVSRAGQRRRVRERSGAALWKRFEREWIPMENRYFEAMGVRERCDLVLGDPYE